MHSITIHVTEDMGHSCDVHESTKRDKKWVQNDIVAGGLADVLSAFRNDEAYEMLAWTVNDLAASGKAAPPRGPRSRKGTAVLRRKMIDALNQMILAAREFAQAAGEWHEALKAEADSEVDTSAADRVDPVL